MIPRTTGRTNISVLDKGTVRYPFRAAGKPLVGRRSKQAGRTGTFLDCKWPGNCEILTVVDSGAVIRYKTVFGSEDSVRELWVLMDIVQFRSAP
jgi:hypothetical protein